MSGNPLYESPNYVKGSIRTRSVEMFLATVMVFKGVVFMLPGETLQAPQWHLVRDWVAVFPGNEAVFGAMVLGVGAARWAALIVNGWWRETPFVRFLGCAVGVSLWTLMMKSFLAASTPGIPAVVAWVAAACAFEMFSAQRCAVDAYVLNTLGLRRRMEESRRGGDR